MNSEECDERALNDGAGKAMLERPKTDVYVTLPRPHNNTITTGIGALVMPLSCPSTSHVPVTPRTPATLLASLRDGCGMQHPPLPALPPRLDRLSDQLARAFRWARDSAGDPRTPPPCDRAPVNIHSLPESAFQQLDAAIRALLRGYATASSTAVTPLATPSLATSCNGVRGISSISSSDSDDGSIMQDSKDDGASSDERFQRASASSMGDEDCGVVLERASGHCGLTAMSINSMLDAADWRPLAVFNCHHYVRHLLDATDDYELMVRGERRETLNKVAYLEHWSS
jgi:hypothetical protein